MNRLVTFALGLMLCVVAHAMSQPDSTQARDNSAEFAAHAANYQVAASCAETQSAPAPIEEIASDTGCSQPVQRYGARVGCSQPQQYSQRSVSGCSQPMQRNASVSGCSQPATTTYYEQTVDANGQVIYQQQTGYQGYSEGYHGAAYAAGWQAGGPVRRVLGFERRAARRGARRAARAGHSGGACGSSGGGSYSSACVNGVCT